MKKENSVIFLCGTEYQLLMAFILSVTTYRELNKTLVLSDNHRVSYAYAGALGSCVWDEVILADDANVNSENSLRAISAAINSDIVHFFSFGFKLHNYIFGVLAKRGKRIILTEEGLLTYHPKRAFENWVGEDIQRLDFTAGFDLGRISEIWLCEPGLYSDDMNVPLRKIDIDFFVDEFKKNDSLQKKLKDIFMINQNFSGFHGKNKFYFQQYVSKQSDPELYPILLLNNVISDLVVGDDSYIRKHPALVKTNEEEKWRGPWEVYLLLSEVLSRKWNPENQIYFSFHSSAMLGSVIFNGGRGTYFYLYKIIRKYTKKSYESVDEIVCKMAKRFPDAHIYVPENWDDLLDLLKSIAKDGVQLNFDAIPRNGDDEEQLRKLKAPAQSAWGVADWLGDRTPIASRVFALQTMLQANPDVGTLGVAVIVPEGANLQKLVKTLESLDSQYRPVDGLWLIGRDICNEVVNDGVSLLCGDAHWAQLLSARIKQGDVPDFIWILRAGDCLVPHATLLMGEYRLRNPDSLVWYVDEVECKDGKFENPMLKPDFNVDLLRSYPYVGQNLILSTAAVQAVGGLDDRVEDLAHIDLIWRLVEKVGPPAIGHVPEVLLISNQGLMGWVSDVKTMTWFPVVTQAHFVRMELDAQVQPESTLGLFRIEYPLCSQPLISIIIPTRDQFPILRDCIEGLIEHTAYANYELLVVDNCSVDSDANEFLTKLASMKLDRVRVLRWPKAFNFAAINNFAVEQARGDVLLFLNNDIQFSSRTRSDWLERLLRLVLRPEVGMAGPRLNLLDGRVDQCGQVLGLDNCVGLAFRGENSSKQGYMYRLVVQQNVSALSASCLMMRREVFEELGGFDAQNFPIFYADTDLCMKATQAGYLLALEPDVGLFHMGGATRLLPEKFGLAARADDQQRDSLYARWLPLLARDPYYHPAFGKLSPGFYLSQDASRIQKPLPGRPLPVVLAAHADWQGCGHYRILHPFKAMANELRFEGGVKHGDFHFADVADIQPDVIVLQGAWLNDGILAQIRRYREITGAKVVLEFDDYLPNIPTRSIYRQKLPPGLIRNMRRAIERVDWLVVSTPALAQEYAEYHHDIRIARNGLHPDWWFGLSGKRRVGKKMRVGWAGGSSHTGDLAEIRSVFKELEDEVEWVFMGMKPEGVICEFHKGVPIDNYPKKLAGLNLDLAVVPLEINQFNRCKSNLRLLELGACGVPVIATDIEPYRDDLPVTLVRNRHQDWVAAIRSHLADPDALATKGDALRDAVLRDWMLEGDFLDQWVHAWGGDEESAVHSPSEEEDAIVVKPRKPRADLDIWLDNRIMNEPQSHLLAKYFSDHGGAPTLSVFVLGGERPEDMERTLSSLETLSGGFGPTHVFIVGEEIVGRYGALEQFQYVPARSDQERIVMVNHFASEPIGDWLLVVDAGDEFTSAGLAVLAQELLRMPGIKAAYADGMVRDHLGELIPFLRPDFNLDLLLSAPETMARHWVFRRDIFVEMGGFDPEFSDVPVFDFLLRLIDADGVSDIVHVDEPLLISREPVMKTRQSEQTLLLRYLHNRGYQEALVSSHLSGCYRIEYGHQKNPVVSIIIPTRNQLSMLVRCVDSLLEKTAYKNYEVIIVDNGSDEEDACAWLNKIEVMKNPQLRILRYPYPFNYSAMNNLAASQARGEYLVLLNNDTVIIRGDWLDALLNHAQRPEVGIVGAKLLFLDGRVQHAGVVLGLRGPADHPFIGGDPNAAGYMYRLQVDQDYSAVTAACLMIRASLYEAVGGLDEGAFKVSYNDVDLCLKVRDAGYLLVWTPHAVLMHEGSVSQTKVDKTDVQVRLQRFRSEQDALYAKWLPIIAKDPAYNQLLTVQGHGFSVDMRNEFNWRPLRWRPLPVTLSMLVDRSSSSQYRIVYPSRTFNALGLASASISDQGDWLIEAERLAPDAIVFQCQLRPDQLNAQQRLTQFSSCHKVAELDDYLLGLPRNSTYREHMPKDALKILRESLRLVDRLVVSTAPLAEALHGLHPDIRVVENRLPLNEWLSVRSLRRQGKRPRVGWGWGGDHYDDLAMLVDVVEALANEVEWVFLGACPRQIRPYAHELHPNVAVDSYPARLAGLNLDLALAPLEDTRFNQCKSNVRLLEYGMCGFPVICSDVVPYRGSLPVTRVKPRFKDWVDAIRTHLADLDASARMGDALREAVLQNWVLDERNATYWLSQWTD